MSKNHQSAEETVQTPLTRDLLEKGVIYLYNMTQEVQAGAKEHKAAESFTKILLEFIAGVDIQAAEVPEGAEVSDEAPEDAAAKQPPEAPAAEAAPVDPKSLPIKAPKTKKGSK